MDNQTNSRYDIILERDLLNSMGLDIKFTENIMIGGDIPYKRCSAPMDNLSKREFKSLTDKPVKPE